MVAAPSEALQDEDERDEHPEPGSRAATSGNGVSGQEEAAEEPNPDDRS